MRDKLPSSPNPAVGLEYDWLRNVCNPLPRESASVR